MIILVVVRNWFWLRLLLSIITQSFRIQSECINRRLASPMLAAKALAHSSLHTCHFDDRRNLTPCSFRNLHFLNVLDARFLTAFEMTKGNQK